MLDFCNSSSMSLSYLLHFNQNSRQLIFKLLSNRLNTRPYNRLDREIVDFKKCKGGLVILCTTKCFHHQDGEDADNDKRCKTHTQHQKWIKHCRTITCLLAYTQHRRTVGAQSKQWLWHILTPSQHNKNKKTWLHSVKGLQLPAYYTNQKQKIWWEALLKIKMDKLN